MDAAAASRHRARAACTEMDGVIASFLRGQALSCLILGTFYAVGLSLIGLNFGVLIGLVCGPAELRALCRARSPDFCSPAPSRPRSSGRNGRGSWCRSAYFVAGQMIEGNVLQPFLVGKSIGLHPVWLMFALLAFGYLFGFPGPPDRGAGLRRDRRADAFRDQAIHGQPVLYRRVEHFQAKWALVPVRSATSK